jgi:hypothetical protein
MPSSPTSPSGSEATPRYSPAAGAPRHVAVMVVSTRSACSSSRHDPLASASPAATERMLSTTGASATALPATSICAGSMSTTRHNDVVATAHIEQADRDHYQLMLARLRAVRTSASTTSHPRATRARSWGGRPRSPSNGCSRRSRGRVFRSSGKQFKIASTSSTERSSLTPAARSPITRSAAPGHSYSSTMASSTSGEKRPLQSASRTPYASKSV